MQAEGASVRSVIQGASDSSTLPIFSFPGGTGIAIRIDGFEAITPATPAAPSSASRSTTWPPLEWPSRNSGTSGRRLIAQAIAARRSSTKSS